MTYKPRILVDCDGEVWKDVPDAFLYQVSNLGRVRSFVRHHRTLGVLRADEPHEMALHEKRGYLTVLIRRNGRPWYPTVHTLVLSAFVCPRPEGMQACHNNGVRTDNRLENLRWDTQLNNIDDRERHGTTARGLRNGKYTKPESRLSGERNGMARLSRPAVALMKYLRAEHDATYVDLGEWMGVTPAAARYAVIGATWKGVA